MFDWKKRFYVLRDEAKDGDGGGGGGNDADSGNKDSSKKAADAADALAKENAALKEKLAKFESSKDSDLNDRTKQDREASDKKVQETKAIEQAVGFNLQATDFLKKNAALLPESVKDLFSVADKETWDSPVVKSSEIKSGIIQQFFAVQANHDLLTASQKTSLADYLKLTKDGKRDRAQSVYDTIFEPALEMLRAVKKADQVQRARNGYGDDSDSAYKQRLVDASRAHYLGEKKHA
jgi:hypothetical protein